MKTLTYAEVLDQLESGKNHLLVGNGFNYGLGVSTGYKEIFEKMMEGKASVYQDATELIEASDYDLELFIRQLTSDINEENVFLRKYVHNKVKLDFMQSLQQIVKEKIKNVYAEKNDGVYILLEKFDNYFTLNYDSFLYQLLLKFSKGAHAREAVVFPSSGRLIQEDLDSKQDQIYSELKMMRENGEMRLEDGSGDTTETMLVKLSDVTLTSFLVIVYNWSKRKGKNWTKKDIRRAAELILDEENNEKHLGQTSDGFVIRQPSLFDGEEDDLAYDFTRTNQNFFFLHGAFHIYEGGHFIRKITKASDKALYDRLEEVINSDGESVVCVFQSDRKLEAINSNDYLRRCLEKLRSLSGQLVIIGCSLSDNDDHIFESINASSLDRIYLSYFGDPDQMRELASRKFSDKEVALFDAKTISYEKPVDGV